MVANDIGQFIEIDTQFVLAIWVRIKLTKGRCWFTFALFSACRTRKRRRVTALRT
jgi:hypothetical protein